MNRQISLLPLLITIPVTLLAEEGPFPPAAGREGSDAVPASHESIVAWVEDILWYSPGSHVDLVWMDESRAEGPATSSIYDVVSLGRGGSITLRFDPPIADGEGWDFAVFENAFSDDFLELAFVEVSSDGAEWYRFLNRSMTPSPVGPFGLVDTTHLTGFAGRFRAGFGTPFDLDESGLSSAAFVRIIDVVGDGSNSDSGGYPIYDPYPTVGSAGFDLDAVGVRHLIVDESSPEIHPDLADSDNDGLSALLEYALGLDPEFPDIGQGVPGTIPGGGIVFPYLGSHTGLRYVVEGSDDLTSWIELAVGEAGEPMAPLEDGVEITRDPTDSFRVEVRTQARTFLRLKVQRAGQ